MAAWLDPDADLSLLRRIEDAGLAASAPRQQRWMDGWLLRWSPGKAKRARCVNALAPSRSPIAEQLAACQRLFDAERLPLIVRITPFTEPASLDACLQEKGMSRLDDIRVMLARNVVQPTANAPADLSFRSLSAEALAERVGSFRGSPTAHRQAHAERMAGSPLPSQRIEAILDGHAVACGQCVQQDDLVGLYDIFTTEAMRGRGIATALCNELLRIAIGQGAQHAYLQVDADNLAARRVYQRLGFADAYGYHYRATSQAADPSSA